MITALIVVDMQKDYFSGGKMELTGVEVASRNVEKLLAAFRESVRPIIHIQHVEYDPAAPCFVVGTTGAEIHESAQPRAYELVIQKHYPNSFIQTYLLSHLHMLGVQRVVICGAMSNFCISATARAAAEIGFYCVVVHDACATRSIEFGERTIAAGDVHGSSMATLAAVYAKVMPTNEAVSLTS